MPKSRQRKNVTRRGYKPTGDVARRRLRIKSLYARKLVGLCLHGFDFVKYASLAEHEADQTPNLVCDECGLRIMRIGFYPPAGHDLTPERIDECFQADKAELLAAMA